MIKSTDARLIFTVGHSTRTMEELIRLLQAYMVRVVVDVRHFPSSKKNPQFGKENLEKEFPKAGLEYLWLGELLGGYRHGGYGKYMKTADFEQGLTQLMKIAQDKTTAVMCAEMLFFRCHRRFIADELVKRGWRAIHIFDEKRSQQHQSQQRLLT